VKETHSGLSLAAALPTALITPSLNCGWTLSHHQKSLCLGFQLGLSGAQQSHGPNLIVFNSFIGKALSTTKKTTIFPQSLNAAFVTCCYPILCHRPPVPKAKTTHLPPSTRQDWAPTCCLLLSSGSPSSCGLFALLHEF
jgi:hypothetical protein